MQHDLFGNTLAKPKIPDRKTLQKAFCFSLKGISEEDLVEMIYSKYAAILDYAKLCCGEKKGEKISMLFNPHRYNTRTKNSKSIIEAFNDDSFLSGLARATLFKDGKYSELLYQVLQLGINGVQYANEFPPFIAQKLYVQYEAKKILDPCAGWGGRMIGAASIGSYYCGYEPSTKTFDGLLKLGDFLKSFDNGFSFDLYNEPFEDATVKGQYDFALTSPPYYDIEKYSEESTNSCNRYSSFEKWSSGFYLPMIRKTLLHSPTLCLNIGSRIYDLESPLLHLGADKIKSPLSGKRGLGKKKGSGESFFILRRGDF